jgi:hypothetical protein
MSIYYLFFLHPHRSKMQRSSTHPYNRKKPEKPITLALRARPAPRQAHPAAAAVPQSSHPNKNIQEKDGGSC